MLRCLHVPLPLVACLVLAGAGAGLGDALSDHSEPQFRPQDLDELWSPPGVSLPPAPTLELTEGNVTGRVYTMPDGRPFYAYQGIPFAEPPIGDNRFKVRDPSRYLYLLL